MRRRLAAASALALVLTGTAACGSDSEDPSTSAETDSASSEETTDSIDGLTVDGEFGEQPTVKVDGLEVEGTETAVIIEGDGEELTEEGAAQTRLYIAKASDGSELATSYKETAPYKMVVAEQLDPIAEAVTGKTIGSRVAVVMPGTELYGPEGNPEAGVGPDDHVIVVIDLVESVEPPLSGPEGEEVDPPADAPKPIDEDGDITGIDFGDAPSKAPTELEVITLIEGEGPEVKEGDNVTVDYYGTVWGNGEPFDESFSREPASFQLAKGSLIDGWVQGLAGVPVGSRVMLVIPSELGYGEQGSGPDIPGGATLVFVVDVLGAGA